MSQLISPSPIKFIVLSPCNIRPNDLPHIDGLHHGLQIPRHCSHVSWNVLVSLSSMMSPMGRNHNRRCLSCHQPHTLKELLRTIHDFHQLWGKVIWIDTWSSQTCSADEWRIQIENSSSLSSDNDRPKCTKQGKLVSSIVPGLMERMARKKALSKARPLRKMALTAINKE